MLTLTRKEADIVREAVEARMSALEGLRRWTNLEIMEKMYILRQLIGIIDSAIKGK